MPPTKPQAAADDVDAYEYIEVHPKGNKTPNGYFAEVPLSDIEIIKDFNPRGGVLGDLTQLTDTIRSEGILQPILLREHPKTPDKYQLICGERRFTIAKKLKHDVIGAVIRTDLADNNKALSVALAENSEEARKSMGVVPVGRAFLKLEKGGMSINAISKSTGYGPQTVRRYLKLVKDAPKAIVADVEQGKMGAMAGLQVAKLPTKLYARLKDKITPDMSTEDIKKLAKKTEQDDGAVSNTTAAPTQSRPADVVVWRGKSTVTRDLATVCSFIQTTLESNDAEVTADIGTGLWYMFLGQAFALLTVRGDLDEIPSFAFDDDATLEVGTLVLDESQVPVMDDEDEIVEAPSASQSKKAVTAAKKTVKHIGDCIERYAKMYEEKYAPDDADEEESEEESED